VYVLARCRDLSSGSRCTSLLPQWACLVHVRLLYSWLRFIAHFASMNTAVIKLDISEILMSFSMNALKSNLFRGVLFIFFCGSSQT
jgi:hypothetical protein